MDKERQVRYNSRRSSLNETNNEWWFLIINQNREIIDIQQKIYTLLAPIIEESPSFEGVVKGSGLRYKLLNFESSKKIEPWEVSSVYRNVFKDLKLYDRGTKDGLSNLLADHLES